ncbi:MAG: Asp23/Gls24 family envelope stress response protein [Christensenellaceae bacterium]|jgi:uncharacterized alkaline shock family protein YloU|nr:Asp23/Gls24 family envelope stress response protein [Christensenellaceae bacterium]
MSKKSNVHVDNNKYTAIIASIANAAAEKTEGISRELVSGSGANQSTFTTGNRNVMVYIDSANCVKIDMYVNITYGYSVPDVGAKLQEKIKNDVEETTRFKVQKINLHVSGVNFN